MLIAITTFNQARYTDRCFQSLKHTRAKIICIDDASTDHTRKVCEKFNIEFLGRDKPLGLTYSWNLAYRYFLESQYDYLIISNNDVLIPEGSLEQLIKTLKEHPYVGVMTRRNEPGPWSDLFGVETYYPIECEKVDEPKNYQAVQDFISKAPLSPLPVKIISGFCFGVSREIQKYEYSPGALFNPGNINVGQEKDLAGRVPDKVLCRQAFVYHYKAKSFWISPFKNRTGQDPREELVLFHKPAFEKLFVLKNILTPLKTLFRKYILRKGPFRRPTIVIVVGMHRSGTSALAGALHASGISMGDEQNFIPAADPQNSKGFYENYPFRALNDSLLKKSGYDVKSWALNIPEKIKITFLLHQKMKRLIKKEIKKNRTWGWKDPRNSLTLKIWLTLLKSMHLSNYIKVIYIYRHPESVAKSLVSRGNTDFQTGIKLWGLYNKSILRALRHKKQDAFYVCYEDLMNQSKVVLEKLFAYLCAKPLNNQSVEFIDSKLCHHKLTSDSETSLPLEVKEIFDELNRRKENAPFKCFY